LIRSLAESKMTATWSGHSTPNQRTKVIAMKRSFASLAFTVALLTYLAPATLRAEDKPKPAAKPAPAARRTPPTAANVSYGKHPKQVVDFYQAESKEPTPLVLNIHGGGWGGGSKESVAPDTYLRAGISVVSVEYRLLKEATADGVVPPVKGPLGDAARALQFVRSKAKEWNLDTTKIVATGSSAGACTSLWLAFHDDLADPKSDDPVARESTRLSLVAVGGAQTSLDPQQLKEWTPNSFYGGHAFGFQPDPKNKRSQFDVFLAEREKILPWIKEYSPYELVTNDDPPVALFYGTPPEMGKDQKDPTHSTNFGLALQEKCKSVGVDCRLIYPGSTDDEFPVVHKFILAKLNRAK
jgi:acetyl esterase/lipase